ILVQQMPQFTYNQDRSFRGWLRQITVNKWREKQRRARTRALTEEPLSDAAGPDPAEALWEAEYRQSIVRRALELMQSQFKPSTWKACWEMLIEGRSAEDVGKELGLSPGAVRAAKFRVICHLRDEMAGLLD